MRETRRKRASFAPHERHARRPLSCAPVRDRCSLARALVARAAAARSGSSRRRSARRSRRSAATRGSSSTSPGRSRTAHVDYRDVRDVNGPLTHLVHLVFLALGGADEHRFRVLDLVVTGVDVRVRRRVPAGARARARAPRRVRRRARAWALAGVGRAQRAVPALRLLGPRAARELLRLVHAAERRAAARRAGALRARTLARARAARLLACGALSVDPVVRQADVRALHARAARRARSSTTSSRVPRARRSRAFASAAPLGALDAARASSSRYGDVGAYLRIQLVDVPAMYRFIWPRAAADIFSSSLVRDARPSRARRRASSLLALVVARRDAARARSPWRSLPLCALAQRRRAGQGLSVPLPPGHGGRLPAVARLRRLARGSARASLAAERALVRLVPFVAVGASSRCASRRRWRTRRTSRDVWILGGRRRPRSARAHDYFVYFPEPDFFPWEMRQAARVPARAHAPDRPRADVRDGPVRPLSRRSARARRRTSTRTTSNADAALGGGMRRGFTRRRAGRRASARIRDAHEADMLARLEREPPAAFVFIDKRAAA